jgi:oxygen-independent coproporphyrinogen-3 oxidase
VNHLSCYALTVEENTALHHFIRKGKVPPPPEERQAEQFEQLMDWAEESGWDHYEISNLCLPGHPSKHNSNYWTGKAYWGFGPSAHSYDGDKTRWNGIANNAQYIEAWLNKKGLAYEKEVLTPVQQLNEKIMTGLRKKTGIKINVTNHAIESRNVSPEIFTNWLRKVKQLEEDGYCTFIEMSLILTRKGKLYADFVASELFL